MKPNERSVLRELNKSPFLKYPIKDNISTSPHKVFIMIQAQLGGVELPNEKDAQVIRRQYQTDISIILDHARRLVRCIADCKIVDCDAISTRHALDLSRSLSAGYWENSNLQLRQIQQVGPAATRKLASANINSIEKLSNADTATIERIMGRNPPFGRKMLDSLADFPRLSLFAEITGKVLSKAGLNPRVKIKAQMGFKNTRMPSWRDKKLSLTFMAENSSGTLVYFWRGNLQKLSRGQDLNFDADVNSPEDVIRCQLACDDIVGTVVSFKLKINLAASHFPLSKTGKQALPLSKAFNRCS